MAATSNMETFTISNKFFSFYFSQVSFETLREKKRRERNPFFFLFLFKTIFRRIVFLDNKIIKKKKYVKLNDERIVDKLIVFLLELEIVGKGIQQCFR